MGLPHDVHCYLVDSLGDYRLQKCRLAEILSAIDYLTVASDIYIVRWRGFSEYTVVVFQCKDDSGCVEWALVYSTEHCTCYMALPS